MMAQPYPTHAGMQPGHPGMAHGHPLGMQHPGGGHMGGQPQQTMMQGMHPGVSGPQVTQGPMVTGMPPGAGTPAPGPMHSGNMAMAHLGPQQSMFQQHNPQMNFGQMQMTPQQQMMARQRMMAQMQHQAAQQQQQQHQHQQQQQQQGVHMMPNGQPAYTQAQLAQMKMSMIPPQMQMQAGNAQMQNFQHQQHQQQRILQAQAQQQQQHAHALAAANQRAAQAQQMQMTRSQEQNNQPPHPVPTPTPQPPPQQVPQSQSTPQPPPQQPKPTPQQQPAQPVVNQQPQPQQQPQQQQSQPQPQPPPQQQQQQQPQQSQAATQVAKASEAEEEPQLKQQPDMNNVMLMPDISKSDLLGGNCILQLISYQDNLANPERPNDIDYWEETIRRYFSPFGSLRQQLYSTRNNSDKSFQLQFPSLARFYFSHFACGVKHIFMQSYDHNQQKLPNGGVHIYSSNASLTYVFHNDTRVTTSGQLRVTFDAEQKIEHFNILTAGWQEYIPRSALVQPQSPEFKQSPKLTNKNVKRTQGKAIEASHRPIIPASGVGEYGIPNHLFQFLEVTEVMTAMGPIMEFYHNHPGTGPRESLYRVTQENAQNMNMANANNARLQNQMAARANGQVGFPNQMNPAMSGPNQFQSPAMAHLGIPQAQGSPLMGGQNHTPSPAQNPSAGGVAMIHQMSAQGSNLSGSQGPSTNTSPNVTNKRRRASAVKLEEEGGGGDSNGANKVKPSPKIGGKRQKGS